MNGVTGVLPVFIELCVPARIVNKLKRLADAGKIWAADTTELRLRENKPASITFAGKNISLAERLTAEEISECATKLCRGSVYAHGDTIKEGYISVAGGVRVGVCGTLAPDGRSVREFTSLNIRIPHIVRGVCEPLIKYCLQDEKIRSVLIYSVPGEGKTTLLRDVAAKFGGELSRRVCIVDSRGELYIEEMFRDTMCDVLSGYPKGMGIEIATRTLSPELIVCDELGGETETRAILQAQNSGVPIIASAHASCVSELLSRPNIYLLHEKRVFDAYVGITRERINGRVSRCFIYNIVPCGEVL